MSKLFLIVCLICCATSAPTSNEADSKILNYNYTNYGDGNYYFEFETSNGIFRQEKGELIHKEDPKKSFISVEGSYSYTGDDGLLYEVNYKADDKGYQILKELIPTIVGESFSSSAGFLPPGLEASLLG